jgi:DNA-binding transcriptional MerR regulator
MLMSDETYKLEELATEAEVSPRTVRYYVQRGLLPGPTFRGKDSFYERGHLLRLRAIRRLQEQYLPLDAISEALANRSVDELERLADVREVVTHRAPPTVEPRAPPAVGMSATHWERYLLAPGVELHVQEPASQEARRLVDQLRVAAAMHRPPGDGGKS